MQDLQRIDSPLSSEDFSSHEAVFKKPLSAKLKHAQVYNAPPPTQGVASLAILRLFEKLGVQEGEGFAHIHGLVEATKQAFLFRNAHVGDPRWMTEDAQTFLDNEELCPELAHKIDMRHAAPWPQPSQAGDTTWMGAIDSSGVAVSMIQSLYFEFGSGVFLPQTGILWQNRGLPSNWRKAHGMPLYRGASLSIPLIQLSRILMMAG